MPGPHFVVGTVVHSPFPQKQEIEILPYSTSTLYQLVLTAMHS